MSFGHWDETVFKTGYDYGFPVLNLKRPVLLLSPILFLVTVHNGNSSVPEG